MNTWGVAGNEAMTNKSKSWKPAYMVKESPRARRVKLRILPDYGLVLTVPKDSDKSRIGKILEDNRKWIERHLAKAMFHGSLAEPKDLLPKNIAFQANGKTWQVRYVESPPNVS